MGIPRRDMFRLAFAPLLAGILPFSEDGSTSPTSEGKSSLVTRDRFVANGLQYDVINGLKNPRATVFGRLYRSPVVIVSDVLPRTS